MGRAVRYQEILRRLAIVEERFAGEQAGLVLGPPGVRDLDAKTPALVRVGALAAGASEAELTGVLLATRRVMTSRPRSRMEGEPDQFGPAVWRNCGCTY